MQPDTEQTKSVHSDSGRGPQFISPLTPINELDMAHYKSITLPARATNSSASSISLDGLSSPYGGLQSNTPHHLPPAESDVTSSDHPFYPLLVPTPLNITMPAHETPPTNRNTIFTSSLLTLGTTFVLLLYLITPAVITLLPVFPTMWSRLLMSLELLALAQWLVVRILLKTTKR